MTDAAVAVVGTGRVGLMLARALGLSGREVRLLARSPRAVPTGFPQVETDWHSGLAASRLVIIAVPDDVIGSVAARLATSAILGPGYVVMHTSGLHGEAALSPLRDSGAALGSLHPLQAIAEGQLDPAILRGTPAIVEGDLRAVTVARELAESFGMSPVLELTAAGKVSYHAGAVIASNYLVVLVELAERLARAGGAGEGADQLFQPIMRRTLANIAAQGSVAALTGPIRRGDVGTVAAHLAVLQGNEREIYIALGREALDIARTAGLGDAAAAEIAALLTGRSPSRHPAP
ncbi:MAG: Rossmann-like and DUF2520 domain-containing protein [Gemmatimonadales bacterium]